jgi:hypothetical protein
MKLFAAGMIIIGMALTFGGADTKSELDRCRSLLEQQSENKSLAPTDLNVSSFEEIVRLKKEVKELKEKLEICEGVK